MTEKAVAGQYGGPKPRTWFQKGGNGIMKKGDRVYVLSKQFREDRKKEENSVSCSLLFASNQGLVSSLKKFVSSFDA